MRRFSTVLTTILVACSGTNPNLASKARPPVLSEGIVLSPDGKPIANAIVTIKGEFTRPSVTRTNNQGLFRFNRSDAEIGISATATPFRGGFKKIATASDGERITIQLDREPAMRLTGQLTGPANVSVEGTRVLFHSFDDSKFMSFNVEASADGSFTAHLPPGSYYVRAESPHLVSGDYRGVAGASPVRISVFERARIEAPATKPVIDWLGRQEHRDPSSQIAALSSAQIVGLGEATHGTSDFFRWKTEVILELVREHNFRSVIVEADWTAALAVDDYIQTGAGDPAAAIAGLKFWTIDTKEFTELVASLREFNKERADNDKAHLFGMDMQMAADSSSRLFRWLREFDPKLATRTEKTLGFLTGELRQARRQLRESNELQKDVERALTEVENAVAATQSPLTSISSLDWRLLQQNVQVLKQTIHLWQTRELEPELDLRNLAMAKNIRWVHELDPTTGTIAWAHNGHLGKGYSFATYSSGVHLAEWFGSNFISVGFAFGEGQFQARDYRKPGSRKLGVNPITVSLPPAGFAERSFALTNAERLLIDLRSLESAPLEVRRWFEVPRYLRELGSGYSGDHDMELRHLPTQYDMIAFVRKTTAARPTPTGVRGPNQ